MSYKIVIKKKALKEIERLPKIYIPRIRKSIDQLAENPYLFAQHVRGALVRQEVPVRPTSS